MDVVLVSFRPTNEVVWACVPQPKLLAWGEQSNQACNLKCCGGAGECKLARCLASNIGRALKQGWLVQPIYCQCGDSCGTPCNAHEYARTHAFTHQGRSQSSMVAFRWWCC